MDQVIIPAVGNREAIASALIAGAKAEVKSASAVAAVLNGYVSTLREAKLAKTKRTASAIRGAWTEVLDSKEFKKVWVVVGSNGAPRYSRKTLAEYGNGLVRSFLFDVQWAADLKNDKTRIPEFSAEGKFLGAKAPKKDSEPTVGSTPLGVEESAVALKNAIAGFAVSKDKKLRELAKLLSESAARFGINTAD